MPSSNQTDRQRQLDIVIPTLVAVDKILQKERNVPLLQVAATPQLVGDVGGDILAPVSPPASDSRNTCHHWLCTKWYTGTKAKWSCFAPQRRMNMDNLKIKGAQDRSKINMHEPHEVQYWTKHLKVSKEQLQKAVDKVGNAAAAVRKELAA
jgi:hypothetical protein